MFNGEWLIDTILLFVPLMLSLTVHEFAHARTALAFGDPSALRLGRVSLNPLVHLDPLGTLVLVLTRCFGWAKPVPVNPLNLQPRRLGSMMVSLAGPASNLLLAIVAGIIIRVLIAVSPVEDGPAWMATVFLLLFILMIANIALSAFNLLPLFPLDGHHILRELLPRQKHASFMEWQLKYGRFLLAGLIFVPMLLRLRGSGGLGPVGWVIVHLQGLAVSAFGIAEVWQRLP